eukprot:756214-Hanusia_phi.AAC.1
MIFRRSSEPVVTLRFPGPSLSSRHGHCPFNDLGPTGPRASLAVNIHPDPSVAFRVQRPRTDPAGARLERRRAQIPPGGMRLELLMSDSIPSTLPVHCHGYEPPCIPGPPPGYMKGVWGSKFFAGPRNGGPWLGRARFARGGVKEKRGWGSSKAIRAVVYNVEHLWEGRG